VGRRDRERARRRHAIEKSQRETGVEPAPKPERERPSSRRPATKRPASTRRPASTPSRSREEVRAALREQFNRKGKIGDLDARGRPRNRDMLVHPKITRRVVFICVPVAILGLFQPRLQLLTWLAYGVAFLGLADLARTKAQAILMVVLSVLAVAFAGATLFNQLAA
jgi:hypothetical protein